MASGRSGRALRILKDGTPIAGARTDNFTINREGIDGSDKDDAGWRSYIAELAVQSIDADVEGKLLNSDIIVDGMSDVVSHPYTIDVEGIGSFEGLFMLGSISVAGPHNEAMTFTANIMSDGVIAFTPEAP